MQAGSFFTYKDLELDMDAYISLFEPLSYQINKGAETIRNLDDPLLKSVSNHRLSQCVSACEYFVTPFDRIIQAAATPIFCTAYHIEKTASDFTEKKKKSNIIAFSGLAGSCLISPLHIPLLTMTIWGGIFLNTIGNIAPYKFFDAFFENRPEQFFMRRALTRSPYFPYDNSAPHLWGGPNRLYAQEYVEWVQNKSYRCNFKMTEERKNKIIEQEVLHDEKNANVIQNTVFEKPDANCVSSDRTEFVRRMERFTVLHWRRFSSDLLSGLPAYHSSFLLFELNPLDSPSAEAFNEELRWRFGFVLSLMRAERFSREFALQHPTHLNPEEQLTRDQIETIKNYARESYRFLFNPGINPNVKSARSI